MSTLDCFTPAQVEAAIEEAAVVKAAMPFTKAFVLALFAGAFVAFGGLFYTVFISDATLTWGAQRVVGGLCFCLGLVLVLICGAELFTGNALMVCGLNSGKIRVRGMLRNWAIVYVGNLMGALVVVALVVGAQLYELNDGAVGQTMVRIATSKITPAWQVLFFRGVLCNVFVCLAVWIGFAGRTVVDKVAGILLPIMAFVACGFEHCVANMYFLPMGALMAGAGAGTAAVSLEGIALNLFVVTLGNIVGGALLVGCGYWFAYRRRV